MTAWPATSRRRAASKPCAKMTEHPTAVLLSEHSGGFAEFLSSKRPSRRFPKSASPKRTSHYGSCAIPSGSFRRIGNQHCVLATSLLLPSSGYCVVVEVRVFSVEICLSKRHSPHVLQPCPFLTMFRSEPWTLHSKFAEFSAHVKYPVLAYVELRSPVPHILDKWLGPLSGLPSFDMLYRRQVRVYQSGKVKQGCRAVSYSTLSLSCWACCSLRTLILGKLS